MVENAELGVCRRSPFRGDAALGGGERSRVEHDRVKQRQPEAPAHEGEQKKQGL